MYFLMKKRSWRKTHMSLSSDSLMESTTHCSNSLRPFDLVRERKFTDLKKTNWLSTLKFLQSFKLTSVLWMGSLAGSSACNRPAFESGLLRPGRNQSGQWSPALQPSPSVKSQMRYKSSKLVVQPSQQWRRGEVCRDLQRTRPRSPSGRGSKGRAERF